LLNSILISLIKKNQRTSVANLFNGSVIDVTKIAADSDYKSLLTSYVNAKSPPPLGYFDKWRRFINKQLGRPANKEAEILGTILIALRDATISVLSSSHPYIDRVVVTRPPSLTGLRSEDLGDALKYAGLRSWLDVPSGLHLCRYPSSLSQVHATFAAYGESLCQSYKNLLMCWFEEEDMQPHAVFAASLTENALSLSGGFITSPFNYDRPALVSATNLSYGLAGVNNFTSSDEFWASIGSYTKDTARQVLKLTDTPFTDLLLIGDHGSHPEFLRALGESLTGMTVDNIAMKIIADPTFAAARGAALYGRWRQEPPFNCMESIYCDGKRKAMESKLDQINDWLSYLGGLALWFFRDWRF
jgi:hypothetical protein